MRSVSVTDVRSVLPHILDHFKRAGPDATPMVIRRHLQPMAVLISFEQFDEYRALLAHRARELRREKRDADRKGEGT
jgi:hypothetical protein